MHYTSTRDGEHYGFRDHVEEGLPNYMATSRIPSVAVYNGSLVFAWADLVDEDFVLMGKVCGWCGGGRGV